MTEERRSEQVFTRDALALQAARIEMLALKAALLPGTQVDSTRVLIAGKSGHVDLVGAEQVLAGLPKPIKCASVTENGVMSITCRLMRPGEVRAHAGVGEMLRAEMAGYVSSPRDSVLVIASRDSAVVSAEAVRQWYQDYSLPPELALNGGPPAKGEGGPSIGFVIVFGRTEEVDVREALSALLPPPTRKR